MKTPRIVETLAAHGGIRAIHVRPVPGGWTNTACCYDGFTKMLSLAEEHALCRHPVPKGLRA